ncbi:MAG: hypothetical protein HOB37_05400 [Rhodospirillaceae bacterium]|jgi:hypothetical protein|nr:hypothetical protein [Rhodospirillaceae bacterium]MBT6085370.1 hypothetical protein [Rhodospirillaceae bacterium]MBT6607886.1 hypothetical protein [Rhodospirillaceae bacterium]MBT6885203.1 hypothetical protein [Rhodospirillaceae bacterium]
MNHAIGIEALCRKGIQSMVPVKPTAPIAKNPVAAKPVAKKAKKSSVKIYRGGAANLEEIPIK